MATGWLGVDWKTPEYSKSKINLAGDAIKNSDFSKMDEKTALSILSNWRSAHAYPMQIFYGTAKRYARNSLVAQRLKRLDSITAKLQRYPTMRLSRMQDLGGCRIIVDSIQDLEKVRLKYKNSRMRHTLIREDDYIANPKPDGYRGVHMVYSFRSRMPDSPYNELSIEVQIRTSVQHLWATAIETLSLPLKSNLKAGLGDKRVLRYMELIAALMAEKEGTPIGVHAPGSIEAIRSELRTFSDIDIISILQAYRVTVKNIEQRYKSGYCLLIIDLEERSVLIHPYKQSEFEEATGAYLYWEQVKRETTNAVLVSVSGVIKLRKAYPNYFADVSDFIDVCSELLGQR